jgi:ABC-2 type transport system permease protein
MFREIYAFEVRSGLRRPYPYVYFAILFTLTLLLGMAAAGVFSTTRTDSLTTVNSASAVARILLGTSSSIFGLMINVLLISAMATVIQKDYQYNIHPLFFTKPISKPGYFFGRFLGGMTIAVFILSGQLIGFWLGTLFGMGKPMMGPFLFVNYIQPFLVFTLPNILFLGVVFFSLTTYLRTTMAAYIVAIVLMVLQLASDTITGNIDNKMLAALLEPTGAQALRLVTEYWSPAERNSNLIPLRDALLYNRLLWLGISLFITAISFRGFAFSQFLQPLQLFGRRKRAEEAVVAPAIASLDALPKVQQAYGRRANWRQTWWLTRFELRKMVSSAFFVIMCLLGVGFMILVVRFMDLMYESSTYMVTYKIVESVEGSTVLFMLIFIIFYAGTSLWRDRETRMHELTGVTPVTNAALFFSKLLAFTLASMLMQSVGAVTGVLIQLYHGFTDIDVMQYLVMILRNAAIGVVFVAWALSLQIYSTNKYLGFFLTLVPVIILPIVLSIFELGSPLLDFNSTGDSMPYSDMNGYGGSFLQWPFYRLYWYSLSAVLCVLALLLYPRGKESSIRARWHLSQAHRNNRSLILMVVFLTTALASGGFIYWQTRVLVDDTKPKDRERDMAALEKRFSKYRDLPQPRITAVSLSVDIKPEDKTLDITGQYTLLNRTSRPIDTVYIDYRSGKKSPYHYPVMKFNTPSSVAVDDPDHGIRIYRLKEPILPGDSIRFDFVMKYVPNGYFARMNSPVVDNGTFINSSLLPTIGYNPEAELSQNAARKEYGLKPKARMAGIDDSAAMMRNYISRDADWIRFETTVSTAAGQRAIAPGYLVKDWKKGDRHYFQYKMDSPILHFFSFLSAKYSLRRDRWNDVAIEIWYQEGHEYNIDRMIASIKKSLDYYTKHFGPYQHRQVRIIEFPRYSSFAQSFPNTIPFSEAIGFITKVEDDEDAIDVPFYVTAHEVAHQWWAHQVIGGDVQGSVLMSETMSQYSALMVMQQEYGKAAMKKFLKYEMDRYLMGRTAEWRGEMPLMKVENQQYIHYNKGSVVMYALQDFLGEETLNGAIRTYLNKTKFSGPPYTNARDFVAHIRSVTPDSLQYLVTDLFERITIYENYVKSLDYKRLPDSSYQVTLTVGSAKFYSDSLGKQRKAEVNDYMDLAVFAKEKTGNKEREVPLLMQRVKMDKPEKTFSWNVKTLPHSVGIDPYLKLIDRTPANNSYDFGEKPTVPDLKPGGGMPAFLMKMGAKE